ncbi:V-type proton ATPase subunit E-like [Teleopsis dalmanni]|nr:V-type proton ATPase subunit E-like [Teleopsis dalmanni]
MEPQVLLRCREDDLDLIKEVLPHATQQYTENIKQDVNITVATDNYLPADTCGGVELIALNGRVKVPNTLESRLDLISQQLVPEIRNALFGRNTNRKFTD